MSAPHKDVVLAIDLGSGGPKVGYATVDGHVLWWEYHRGDTIGGAAAQDPNEWWDVIIGYARNGLREAQIDPNRVVGISVTGQWSSTVPVDETGRPVSDCLMWCDTHGATHAQKRFGGPVAGYNPAVLATWLRRSGGVPKPTGADPISHMLHLSNDRPDLAGKSRWFLEPVDQLTMRFTGVASASPMSMTGAWLTDNRDLSRIDYDPVLVERAGIDPSKLPPLVQSGSVVGMILPDVARAIGIPESVKVITGAPDLQNAAVASGCVEPLQAHMGMGTSAWVSCPVTFKKTNVITQIASVPGIGDGNYLIANNQDNAGRALEWYRQAVCPDMSYRDLEAEAASSPAGANSVIFTPWLNGERSPVDDRYARGGFHNLSLDATRADMTRAVLEGVAMNMKWLLQSAERFAGAKFDTIRLMGGCAQIDLWCQILADVCDRRLERIEQPLVAGLRGAAIYFGLVEGSISRADVHGLIPIDTVFTPNPDHRAIYDRLFAHFPGLHSRNKRMFQALNG